MWSFNLSYLSLDFQLLSGSSLVVLAFEFESNDAPLFRFSLIENEGICQGHAACGLFQFFLCFLSNNIKFVEDTIKLICDSGHENG